MKKVICIIILFIVIIFLYGRFIEINSITVHDYSLDIKELPESFKELKIVHFSDVLYTKNKLQLSKVTKLINNENPDIIIFSGDLFNKNETYTEDDFNIIKDNLKEMNANLFKFAVIGENDEKYIDKYKDILYEAGFTLLDNKNKLFFYKDETPINIIGINNLDNINELLNTEIPSNYNIVITHKPDIFDDLCNLNIDVVFSGHSLGGMVSLPMYGGIIKVDGAKKYLNKYYRKNNSELYVSNGLGYQNYNFRLLNVPSINVYRFDEKK